MYIEEIMNKAVCFNDCYQQVIMPQGSVIYRRLQNDNQESFKQVVKFHLLCIIVQVIFKSGHAILTEK